MKKYLVLALLLLSSAVSYAAATAATSWVGATVNNVTYMSSIVGLDTSTTVYTKVISFTGPNYSRETKFVGISVVSAALTDTCTVQLYGSLTSAGTTKYLIKSTLVADPTPTSGLVKSSTFDFNIAPFPYYFIGVTTTGDEPESHSVTVIITQ